MDYIITPENLKKLNEKFKNCLCPECLEAYSSGRRSVNKQ